jgi:hypothetical protein
VWGKEGETDKVGYISLQVPARDNLVGGAPRDGKWAWAHVAVNVAVTAAEAN